MKIFLFNKAVKIFAHEGEGKLILLFERHFYLYLKMHWLYIIKKYLTKGAHTHDWSKSNPDMGVMERIDYGCVITKTYLLCDHATDHL